MQESTKYKILKTIAGNPELTQRQLAKELGVSLGKTNYCLRSLIDKGLVKAENFRKSQHRIQYPYKLTPKRPGGKGACDFPLSQAKTAGIRGNQGGD